MLPSHSVARRVALLAYPGAQLLDVAGPADVFSVASREAKGRTGYVVEVLGLGPGPIPTSSGICLMPNRPMAEARPAEFDTVLVAGGQTAAELAKDELPRQWLKVAATTVRRLGAVCTGAWLLAEAGVLSGRRAVTHWRSCDRLAAAHPDITVERDAIYVCDGAIWTSAGVTSGIDLALAMVEEDEGRDLALMVARILVMFLKRPGGQSQFSAPLAAQMAQRSPLREAQLHAAAHPSDDLSVEALAARAHMSPRNFARAFVRETGTTPAVYVEGVRLDAARRLLEDSSLTVDQIARRCGFGEPDTMRRAFLRRLGLSPRDYRARFAAAPCDVTPRPAGSSRRNVVMADPGPKAHLTGAMGAPSRSDGSEQGPIGRSRRAG